MTARGHHTDDGAPSTPLGCARPRTVRGSRESSRVALLTGAHDLSYALGLTGALVAEGISVDFIGSDSVDAPMLHESSLIRFLNLRGDQREDVGLVTKVRRVTFYYLRLIRYAMEAEPRIFHILWNNKFELFDRTLLMLFYKACGKRVVMTAHNVNAARRDGHDGLLNRLSLAIQYRLTDHLFVHTEKMAAELESDFGVMRSKISVIPFGINNTIPATGLTNSEARKRLGLHDADLTALFFGQIAPYKGLDYIVDALPGLMAWHRGFRLIIAGKVKRGSEEYWRDIERRIAALESPECVIRRIEHIPDSDVETYFKAADVLVVPYREIFQSGVPFLAYSFGLPVIATDVGTLRDDVLEGRTGMVCRPRDPADLARAIRDHFESDLHASIGETREAIRRFANERYSWAKVGSITGSIYRKLLAHA